MEFLDDGDSVVLIPTYEDVSLIEHESTMRMLVVETIIVRREQVIDLSELLEINHGRVKDPVSLNVVLHASSEQFVIPTGHIEALNEVPVPGVVPR